MIICSMYYIMNLASLISNFFDFAIVLCTLFLIQSSTLSVSYGSEAPTLSSDRLMAERVSSGFENPTGIAFLGSNDILVIEKDTGAVLRMLNGEVLPEPLAKLDVANEVERGLLGIAVSKNQSADKNYVFLYYTEAKSESGESADENGDEPLGNRLYRFELSEDGTKLLNPKLLLDLPYEPGPAHNGGAITVGPDDNVYVVLGNLLANADERFEGHPLDMYYAYGIRNSFGLAFDPVTGKLWDTENGGRYDEINLVEPGFNSGWEKVIGKASLQEDFNDSDLVDFNGKGKYSDPEFSWEADSEFRTAPTSIVFLNSDKFGQQYENDMFVGDVHGNIYHFKLSTDRTRLLLAEPLADGVANDSSEIEDLVFAEIPGIITDLKVGPDGYLYLLLYDRGELFRIVPVSRVLT